MPVPVFRTTDEMIRELQNEGHSVIYERTVEYPVVKGVGQIPPAKHLLAPNGHVLAIHVEPRTSGAGEKVMTASVMSRGLKTTLSR